MTAGWVTSSSRTESSRDTAASSEHTSAAYLANRKYLLPWKIYAGVPGGCVDGAVGEGEELGGGEHEAGEGGEPLHSNRVTSKLLLMLSL